MEARVSIHDFTSTDNGENNTNNCNHIDVRSADSYIDESNLAKPNKAGEIDRISNGNRDAGTEDSLHHDEGSNTVGCFDAAYKSLVQIPNVGVEDDRSSLESSGSLRNSCRALSAQDVLPIETARARFVQIVVDNFISEHIIEKRGGASVDVVEPGDDKSNKRKYAEVQYEGDPSFVLPLMYVANLYETLVSEANIRISLLNGLREKTIGVALEASGGLYRKLTQKFPKTGSYSFKRRELATSVETRNRFPELVVQEEKRVRFVVANGLNIVERPNSVPADDAEWFKRLTGRTEIAVTSRDYKFYNPRHKVRRALSNTSPTVPGLLSYHNNSDLEFQSATEPSSPAKFCDECGSPYLRVTSKFCSECGTKRFGI